MPNRINGYKATAPPAPVPPVATGGARITDKTQGGVNAAAAPPTAPASTADTVKITGSGLALQKLGEAVAKAAVVDAQKVASVKQAVHGGVYQVDTGRVADKIIQFENGLK